MKNCLIFFLGLTVSLYGQQNLSDRLFSLFINQLTIFPQEKLYLHTDKPFYITGEKIWFRAHLVSAVDHVTFPFSRYVYVELHSPSDSLVSRVKIQNDSNAYHGHIEIPQDIPEGEYFLRAYTNFMLSLDEHYLFTKTVSIGAPASRKLQAEIKDVKETKDSNRKLIPVPATDNNFDVTFYPEGGYLLQGVTSRIAFKAQKSDGCSADVEGIVYDNNGNEKGRISTEFQGMGSFSIHPEEDAFYHVVCTDDKKQSKRFEIPVAKKTGHILSVNNMAKEHILVSILKNVHEVQHEMLYLLAHTRGKVHFISQWNEGEKFISLSKKEFPSGVLHLVLFDSQLNPVSERLVFVNNDDRAQVSFQSDRDSYGAREPVNSRVTITDEAGEPLQGSFSVAVTDDKAVLTDSGANILTFMLLTSDLRGNIENPAAYFSKDNSSGWALDLLMLTQGWRRYDVAAIAQGRIAQPSSALELGAEISGRVRRMLLDRPVEKAKISMPRLTVYISMLQ